jgi:hypothetical protein
VAAGEDQLESLVTHCRLVDLIAHCPLALKEADFLRERSLAANPVDRAVASSREQPRRGVLGHPISRPPLGRDRERLLRSFLGEIEVAEEADERGKDVPPVLSEGLLQQDL